MRYVKISDLLDGLDAPNIDTVRMEAVSAERIKEIAMNKIHGEQKRKLRPFKRPAVVLLAAALGLMLSATAFAAVTGVIRFDHKGTDADFYDGAFGTGVSGREVFDLPITDSEGNVVTTEHYPAIERVEADPEQAAALVGDYLVDMDMGVTVGDLNYILRSVMLDENNIGVLTFELQNPQGLEDKESFVWLNLYTASGQMMDERDFLLSRSEDGTEAVYVYYFTPFEPCPGEELILTWNYDIGKKVESSLPLENSRPIPARTFSAAEGLSASVSPVGLMLRYDLGSGNISDAPASASPAGSASPVPTPEPSQGVEKIESEIVIRFTDGSEYAVLGENLVNFSVSSISRDKNMKWFAFNRLADADGITEIQVNGHWYDRETVHEYALTLMPND